MQISIHVTYVAGCDSGRNDRDSHSIASIVRVHAAHVVRVVECEGVIIRFYLIDSYEKKFCFQNKIEAILDI
jgi:hypothetical protein